MEKEVIEELGEVCKGWGTLVFGIVSGRGLFLSSMLSRD